MSTAQPTPILVTPQSLAVVTRYSNAYFSARAIVGFGTVIKAVGIVLAVLLVLGTLLADAQYLLAAIPLAVVIGIMFFFWGILVAAQGEILKAALDTAVNGSPFLSNEQRARVMSLPETHDASGSQDADKCPNCGQPTIEIYERSREGQNWICANCKHTWQTTNR
jgi:hypothetical protein